MKLRFVFVIACLFALPAMSAEEDAIVGIWATDKAEAHVEIWREADKYHGRIVWLKAPFYAQGEGGEAGSPKLDRQNPDPALRDRLVLGLVFLKNFRYAGDARWVDGTIYDPENGKTYQCRMTLRKDGSLKVRGFVGMSLFGRTTEWTPVLMNGPTAFD